MFSYCIQRAKIEMNFMIILAPLNTIPIERKLFFFIIDFSTFAIHVKIILIYEQCKVTITISNKKLQFFHE